MTIFLIVVGAIVAVVVSLAVLNDRQAANSKAHRYRLADAGREQVKKYPLEIVGESHYQDTLAGICGGHTSEGHFLEIETALKLDDDNRHDSNAVAVHIQNRLVGYLSRENAKLYRALLKKAPETPTQVAAVVMGRWRRNSRDVGSFGVFLALNLAAREKRPKGRVKSRPGR